MNPKKAKQETNDKRRQGRDEALRKARESLASGDGKHYNLFVQVAVYIILLPRSSWFSVIFKNITAKTAIRIIVRKL